MKSEKIYSHDGRQPKVYSLYYYLELEDSDIVSDKCFLKFGGMWTNIVPRSIWIGKTLKTIRERYSDGGRNIIIAERFDNV